MTLRVLHLVVRKVIFLKTEEMNQIAQTRKRPNYIIGIIQEKFPNLLKKLTGGRFLLRFLEVFAVIIYRNFIS